MSAGLSAVLDRVFSEMRLHRVEANIQPANAPSIKLVQRLGFQREGFSPAYLLVGGEWRDPECWALLRDEWRR
jgi:ribosomal-protein-alanine N-acetyltransferase